MNAPKIRINGYGREWNSLPLGDVFDLRNGYTPSKAVKSFWEGGTIPWFRMEDIRANGGILSDSIQHITPSAIKGNGLFSPFSIILATTATIGVHAMLIADSLANQQFTNLKICKSLINSYDPYFVYYAFFKVDDWCIKNTNSGGLLAVDIKSLCKYDFSAPSLQEQRSIATYFRHIDKLIETAEKKLISLKQVKEASLQSMFPKEECTVPQVRFKGFEDEWKKFSFKDITYASGIKNRDNLPLESYSISNEFGFIPQSYQFENGGTMTSADKRMYYIVSPNSFAYNPARINIGSIGYYTGNKDVIVSSLYEVFKTDNNVCDKFLDYWFKSDSFKQLIKKYQEGGVRLYFFYDKLCMCDVLLPSIAEQRKIASFFVNLDKTIDNQRQRLELLKRIKATCLSEMFV